MEFLIVYLVIISGITFLKKRKLEGITIRMGWLMPDRCRSCGVTLRFQPFNGSTRFFENS
jgi:hypothetical protein